MKNLILIGAGGYAKSVLDSIDYFNYHMMGFIDDYKTEKEHLGYPILGNTLDCIDNPGDKVYFISIGNNQKRKQWYDILMENNYNIVNVVDNTALISNHAKIGNGCFIGKMAIINSHVAIGDNCVINTKALLEHGCAIGNHVNVSTNTVLNGDVVCADGCFIGSASVINGQRHIGEWAVVGAGSVVVKNVEDNITVVGCPAYNIEERKKEK